MLVRGAGDPEPISGFRYAVEIEGIVAGWFTRCSGLSVERDVRPYEEGGLNAYVHQLPGRITRTRITLERGIAGPELWRWFAGEQDKGLYDGQRPARDVTIILYGADLAEAGRWHLQQALPARWSGPEFRDDGERAAVESLELAQGDGGPEGAVQRAMDEEAMGEDGRQPLREAIDLPALAQRVFGLLRQELRVERERLGRRR